MEVKRISPFLSVSPQIYPAHIERLAAKGFKTIINNRPDNEADDQPLQAELAKEAARHGMLFINIPVIPGQITEANIKEFGKELFRVQGPVLAFCRSGTRSTCLWAMHEARHMGSDAIINFAATIGYDLKGQKEHLDEAAAQAAGFEKHLDHEHAANTYDVVVVGGGVFSANQPQTLTEKVMPDWVDVSHDTLRHSRYENVFSLGDVCSAPNAKTLAAARIQAPVVAANLIAVFDGKEPVAEYNGYGSCPLTVERGKIVLAEFGYGGKQLPTFPEWLINSDKASKAAWFLKEKILPTVYYQLMLKGREWLARPHKLGGS